MDVQELRNLQEAYTEVYNELDEELTGVRRMKALDIMRKEKFKGKKARQVADIVSGKEGSKSPSGEGINLPTKRGGGGEKKEPKTGRGGDWYADRGVKKEQVDIYDIILSHLLDEGYASTAEAADKIILNMSESWFEEIVKLNEARAEEKRGLGSTGRQRQRQKTGVVTSSGEVAHPATSYSGGQNPHLRGKDYVSKTQRREASRRYVDQPGGIYAKPENKQGEGRYAKMQAKKRDQSHMHSRYD